MISTANHYYFNEQPIMTDNEYDIIKEYIEDNYPDTEFDIGAPVSQGKVKLSYPMPSMNKKKMKNLLINGLKNILLFMMNPTQKHSIILLQQNSTV